MKQESPCFSCGECQSEEFEQTVPLSFKIIISADNDVLDSERDLTGTDIPSYYIKLLKELGQQIIIEDFEPKQSEIRDHNIYINMLEMYRKQNSARYISNGIDLSKKPLSNKFKIKKKMHCLLDIIDPSTDASGFKNEMYEVAVIVNRKLLYDAIFDFFFLALCDDKISTQEEQYINYYFEKDYTIDSFHEYTLKNFSSDIKLSMNMNLSISYLVERDNSILETNGYLLKSGAKAFYQIFRDLGEDFFLNKNNGNASVSEREKFEEMLEKIKSTIKESLKIPFDTTESEID